MTILLLFLFFLRRCQIYSSNRAASNSTRLPSHWVTTSFHLCFHIFLIYFPFQDRLSCSPGWPWIHSIAEGGHGLLSLLPLPPKCWDYRWVPPHHILQLFLSRENHLCSCVENGHVSLRRESKYKRFDNQKAIHVLVWSPMAFHHPEYQKLWNNSLSLRRPRQMPEQLGDLHWPSSVGLSWLWLSDKVSWTGTSDGFLMNLLRYFKRACEAWKTDVSQPVSSLKSSKGADRSKLMVLRAYRRSKRKHK